MRSRQALWVLASSTFAFTICFAVWMIFAVLGIPVAKQLVLNETEFGLLAATPVLSGALVRVPLGIWTDRFGGRIVFYVLMLVAVPPVWLISYADRYWHFLALGLCVGLAGGAFSVGTPYVARWFERSRQGLAMGVFGAGNSGSALTKFVAPAIIAAWGWQALPKVYAAVLLLTAVLFWFGSASDPSHRLASRPSLREQLALLSDPRVLRYCQYYSVVFGGYVALALWMTKYYTDEYGLSIQTGALLAACFSLPGGVLRALGGLGVGSLRRSPGDLVGDVDLLGCVLPALVSPDRIHDSHREWAEELLHRPYAGAVHDLAFRRRCGHGDRQGLGLQVHCG